VFAHADIHPRQHHPDADPKSAGVAPYWAPARVTRVVPSVLKVNARVTSRAAAGPSISGGVTSCRSA